MAVSFLCELPGKTERSLKGTAEQYSYTLKCYQQEEGGRTVEEMLESLR